MKTFPISNLEKYMIANRRRRYERYLETTKDAKPMTFDQWDFDTFDKETPNEPNRE